MAQEVDHAGVGKRYDVALAQPAADRDSGAHLMSARDVLQAMHGGGGWMQRQGAIYHRAGICSVPGQPRVPAV